MISKIGLGALLSLVPELESHEGSFGEHDLEVSGRTVTIGPYNYSLLLGRISSCIYDSELIFPFNWSVWQDEAEQICNDPEIMACVDLETIRELLTLHLRKERFCEEHLAVVCESGVMLSILQRLQVLWESGIIEACPFHEKAPPCQDSFLLPCIYRFRPPARHPSI